MKNLLRYIVFFICYFNAFGLGAATIEFVPIDDEAETLPNTSFKGALNLPHPTDMNRILKNTDSTISKIMLIGGYFNFKYPEDAIKSDFSSDVATIFPELKNSEINDRMTLIRGGVRLYRWGMDKYNQIKEKLLMPPEPPLIVDDSEYALPEEYEYLEADEDKFAIKYDFKKVIPYSGNPRDIASVRAKEQRKANSKKNKTDFEQFTSMVDNIEFSKIPSYGIDIANPLVGNAGTTPWEKEDGFNVRLITELSEYNQVPEILGGVHVHTPSHRFILGLNLSDTLQKPKFEVLESQNVQKFEYFYPIPETIFAQDMIGAYAGELLFPIKITPEHKDKPISLKLKFNFESCDSRLDCKTMEFIPKLTIENAKNDNFSTFQNFVRQNFYNLPTDKIKKITLNSVTAQLSPDKKNIEKLHLRFTYNGTIHKFRVFLEDNQNTIFSAPSINIYNNEIKVTAIARTNTDWFDNRKISVTAQLNMFDKFRTNAKIVPQENAENSDFNNLKKQILSAFLVGLCLILTPIGFLIFGINTSQNNTLSPKVYQKTIAGICSGIILFTIAILYLKENNVLLYWGMQYQSVAYLTIATTVLILLKSILTSPTIFKHTFSQYSGLISGVILIVLLPLSFTPNLKYVLFYAINSTNTLQLCYLMAALAAGCCLPYYLMSRFQQINFSFSVKNLIFNLASLLLSLQFIVMALIVLIQCRWSVLQTISIAFIILWLILKFLLMFANALQNTTLPKIQKKTTEKVLLSLMGLALALAIYVMPTFISKKVSANIEELDTIQQKIHNGETVIVQVSADWCLLCRLNDMIVFNQSNLKKWQLQQKISLITINASYPNREILDYLQRFGHLTPPFYAIYNIQVENGIILPSMPLTYQIDKILRGFS